MGTRTERLRELQQEVERSEECKAQPLTRATERRASRKTPWPMGAVILRAIGLAVLLTAAGFAAIAVWAGATGFERTFAVCWDFAVVALVGGGVCCLASLIVRVTTRRQAP